MAPPYLPLTSLRSRSSSTFSCFLGVCCSWPTHPHRDHGRVQSVVEARHRVRLRQHGVFRWLHLRAGSMYENKCTSTHNCGQVASDTASNMAFYSRLSTAVAGRTSALDMSSLLTGWHLLLTGLRVTSWWEHVDTHANPADGGSRQGTSCKLAKRLGIPLEWVKFPFVPACMADAVPQSG